MALQTLSQLFSNDIEIKILNFLNEHKEIIMRITQIDDITNEVFKDSKEKPLKTEVINALYGLFKENKIKRFKYKKSVYYCSLDSVVSNSKAETETTSTKSKRKSRSKSNKEKVVEDKTETTENKPDNVAKT